MLEIRRVWLTPLLKQCFVTSGVALNMAQIGMVMGIASTMLPQLKEPSSPIPIDDEYGSWIVATPGITYLLGTVCIPKVMEVYGRRPANLCSLVVTAISWIGIAFSTNVTILLIARSLQGIGVGMTSVLSPTLTGEYASPKYRGALLMTLSVNSALGVFSIHALGLYLYWKTVALICTGITMVNIVIVIFSPESPSWLALKGQHDKCRRVFRWLRGDTEEEELNKILEANPVKERNSDKNIENETLKMQMKNKVTYLRGIIKKKEFYKPIIIMGHFYALSNWSGIYIFSSYAVDLITITIGKDVNVSAVVLSLDAQRIIFNTLGIIIIGKMKRRTMLQILSILNVMALFVIALYVYARENNYLSHVSMYIGIFLMHVHMISIACGGMPLSYILAGELFPLRFRSVASGISMIIFSFHGFAASKTVHILLKNIGLPGTYVLYCGILIYAFVVVNVMLPETKDKTLHDIEEELKSSKNITGACT